MLLGKRLELLHELVPKASIIGILVNPDAADAEPEIGEVTAAAQTLGQRIQVLSATQHYLGQHTAHGTLY
jgi:putative ABC transport system substrate-binding protein